MSSFWKLLVLKKISNLLIRLATELVLIKINQQGRWRLSHVHNFEDEKVISDSKKLKKDDIIDIDVRNGKINAKVVEVTYGK